MGQRIGYKRVSTVDQSTGCIAAGLPARAARCRAERHRYRHSDRNNAARPGARLGAGRTPRLVAGGQAGGGQFVVGRQAQREQSGMNAAVEFNFVDRDMHRHPAAVVAG